MITTCALPGPRYATHRSCPHPQLRGSRSAVLAAYTPADAKPGQPVCSLCPFLGSVPALGKATTTKLPCVHLGPETAAAPCSGCGGRAMVSVHSCGLHGECIQTTEGRSRLLNPQSLAESQQARQTRLAKQKACDSCPDQAMIGAAPSHPWAVAVRFNWCNWSTPVQNYERFRAGLPENLPLLTVEAMLPGQSPTVPDALHLQADPDSHIVWQKEALFNLAESHLPAECDAVFFLDADMLWHTEDWVSHALQALKHHQTVHLLEWMTYVDGRRKRSGVAVWQETGRYNGFPGGAWGVRRDWFRAVGRFPVLNPVGGGDNTWLHGVCGLALNPQKEGPLYNWARQVTPQLWHTTGPAYLAGVVCADLPHGSKQDRQYDERHRMLEGFGFNPQTMLTVDETGLLSWTPEAPQPLRDWVRQWFQDRREDEPQPLPGL